jgi:phosphoesterase RecJ-like protein
MVFAEQLARAVEIIRTGTRFLLGAHSRLDGDALGSMLVSAHGLRLLGKEVFLYNPDPVPQRLRFLPGANEVRRKIPAGLRFDATLIHDCGARHLLGDHFPEPPITGPLLVLDHHAVVSELGDIVLRDAGAGSAGVIAMRLLSALGVREDALPRTAIDRAVCVLGRRHRLVSLPRHQSGSVPARDGRDAQRREHLERGATAR